MFSRLNKAEHIAEGGQRMGYKIKELRVSKKLTQEELAEKSGVSRGTIAALESGKERSVLTGTLVKLADALDTTVDNLFFTQSV